jgi:hypothetical protein|tara:strand:+ start:108 stop:773 length:666 start_codon:yes stop_codon:yes gene_type:complete
MVKAVVSYNFGGYDEMWPILWEDSDWKYYLFTDKPDYQVDGWETIELTDKWYISDNPKRQANYVKYNTFKLLESLGKEVDLLVVIDANIKIAGPLDDFVNTHLLNTYDGVFLQSNRISAYDDLDHCMKFDKDDEDELIRTAEFFEESGYPAKVQDYFQTTVSIRRNTSGWKVIEEVFTKTYEGYSKRDQPMMNFINWKYPVLDLNLIPMDKIATYLQYEKH